MERSNGLSKEQVKDKQLSKSEEKEVSNEVYVEQLEKRVSELKQENLKLENDKKRFAAKKKILVANHLMIIKPQIRK